MTKIQGNNFKGLKKLLEVTAKKSAVLYEKSKNQVLTKSAFLAKIKMMDRIQGAMNSIDPTFEVLQELQFITPMQEFVRGMKEQEPMKILLDIDHMEEDFKIRPNNFYYATK